MVPVRSHFLNPGSIPYNLPYRGIKVIRNRCRPGDLLASAHLGTSRCMHVCFMTIITALKCQYPVPERVPAPESRGYSASEGTILPLYCLRALSQSEAAPWGRGSLWTLKCRIHLQPAGALFHWLLGGSGAAEWGRAGAAETAGRLGMTPSTMQHCVSLSACSVEVFLCCQKGQASGIPAVAVGLWLDDATISVPVVPAATEGPSGLQWLALSVESRYQHFPSTVTQRSCQVGAWGVRHAAFLFQTAVHPGLTFSA